MGFWWSKANWPAVKGEERRYTFFEDIRKLLTLIEHPSMGTIDVHRLYGKKAGGNYVAYDENNWAGSWTGHAPPDPAKPGEITVVYKDHTGAEDIFINYKEMSEAKLEAYPPIKSDGKLDTRYWKLGVNPNYYCHYNHNAGRPEIGADGRYIIIYHRSSAPPPAGCGFSSYVCDLKAHKWLPRHTHPYRQVAPVKYKSGEVKQRRDPALYGVETKDEYISQSLGTEWDRSKDVVGYEMCKKPRRLTEYVLEGGEPEDPGSDCETSGRCAHDPKMDEAYQDRVIFTIEQHGPSYLKEIDEDFIKEWMYDQAVEWECFAGGGFWSEGGIVYKGTKTIDSTFYVCIDTHYVEPGDCKEPGTGAGADYWITPAHQPTLFVDHPVYASLDDYAWRCNGSSYELTLRKIDSFDWWWDTEHPFISWFLYENHIDDPDNWPLPRGCWRRTWKHSMGRAGTRMWPQEKGGPPGHKKREFIVTQAVYDTIPEANQVYYTVSDAEALYDAAYTDEHEALIKERHDAKATSSVEIDEVKITEPHYEIHPDLVNDLWNALLELDLLDWPGLKQYWRMVGEHSTGPPSEPTSLEAYAAGRALAIADEAWELAAAWGQEFKEYFGYIVDVDATGAAAFDSDYAWIASTLAISLRLSVNDALPGVVSSKRMITRFKYTEEEWFYYQGANEESWEGCQFGFGDDVVTCTPSSVEDVWKWAYVALEPGTVTSDESFYYYWFYGYTMSPWPFLGEGEWLDFEYADDPNQRGGMSVMRIFFPAAGYEHMTLFEIDWDKVPESVFEEDETNAIKINK